MYRFSKKLASAFLSAAIGASLCFSSVLAEDIGIIGDFSENEDITLYEIADTEFDSVPLGDAALLSIPSDAEDELKDRLCEALENYDAAELMSFGDEELYAVTADISDLEIALDDKTDLSSVVQNVIYDNPLFFYADYRHISYSYIDDTFTSVHIALKNSKKKIGEMLENFEKTADEIISEITEKADTDFDKALLTHDYIVERCEYDYESAGNSTMTDAHGAYAALIDHKAVCQGYASAYEYLLTQMGINCVNVYDNDDSHEWSMVELNGNWYHVDLTFDDPGRIGCVSHNYFLLTDDEIKEKASHSAWDKSTSYVCGDDSYSNAIWKNAETAVVYYGDDRYYAYSKPEDNSLKTAIYKVGSDFKNESEFYRLSRSDLWKTPNGSYYIDFFGGLYEYGGSLYFNSASALWKIDLDSDDIEEICTADFGDAEDAETDTSGSVKTKLGQICGSYLDGVIIYYAEGIDTATSAGDSISTDNDNIKFYMLSLEQNIEADITDPITVIEDTESGEKTLRGTVAVDINLAEAITDSVDTVIYFGVYEDNVLKQISEKSLSEINENDDEDDENNANEFEVNIGYSSGRAYTYKIFAWDDAYKPYSQAFTEKIDITQSESAGNELSENEE